MRRIMVAVDGSDKSLQSAEKTAQLMAPESEITLINVIPEAVKEEQINEKIEEMMARAAVYFEERDFIVKKEIHYGHPAEVICNLADENEYELIVIADKGDEDRRFLLGSTSDRVIRHAKTSVLVVK